MCGVLVNWNDRSCPLPHPPPDHCTSVERPPAVGSATQARDLLVLDGELVVVSDLLSHGYVSLGVDDYLLASAEVDHLGIAVGLEGDREGGP